MALFPILASTSGSLRLMPPLLAPGLRSPLRPLVGVAGDLRCVQNYFQDSRTNKEVMKICKV